MNYKPTRLIFRLGYLVKYIPSLFLIEKFPKQSHERQCYIIVFEKWIIAVINNLPRFVFIYKYHNSLKNKIINYHLIPIFATSFTTQKFPILNFYKTPSLSGGSKLATFK